MVREARIAFRIKAGFARGFCTTSIRGIPHPADGPRLMVQNRSVSHHPLRGRPPVRRSLTGCLRLSRGRPERPDDICEFGLPPAAAFWVTAGVLLLSL